MKTSAMYVTGDLGLVPRSSSELSVGTHYTVQSDMLMESINANTELEIGVDKLYMSEEKYPRLAKFERSEIGAKREDDSKVSFKSVTEKGSQEKPGEEITEPQNGEISEEQDGEETSESHY
jgi:hypothetical protein